MGEAQDAAYFAARANGTVPWKEPRFLDRWKDGEWKGEDVWIIGGGPSAKTHDLDKIAHRKVIAVNMGFTICEPTFMFVGSILLLQKLYLNRRPRRNTNVPDINCPVVTHERTIWNFNTNYGSHVLETADQDCDWGKTLKEGVPPFTNSGIMAVNIADILGAKRIFLVGFDMRGGKDGRTANFHGFYPKHYRPPAEHYDKYLRDFERVPKHCRAKVFNCTPNSRMTLFSHVDFEESAKCPVPQ